LADEIAGARMRARLVTEENRKWWTLAAVSVALFMAMLDNTVVNVALPTIQRDLEIGMSELQWIVAGYTLSFAVLLLPGGKLADMYGRRRIFMIGLTVFIVTSLFCGLAETSTVLILSRVGQGIGAALTMPATLAIIMATFPPKERGTALGVWTGASAVALALGPLVGGLIVENLAWSWIFFINLPIGAVGLLLARAVIRESKDTSAEQRLDLPGLVTSAVVLFALIVGLIEVGRYGWGSPQVLTLLAVALVGSVVFCVLELRQRLPMFDLRLFTNRTFAGANAIGLLFSFTTFGVYFFVSLFFQNALGYSPAYAGLAFTPMTLCIIFGAPLAGRFSDRFGPRWLVVGGMVLTSLSLLVFSRLETSSSFWEVLPGLVLGGIGMALAMTPVTSAAMGAVPVAKSGTGSGMLNTLRQIGGALGIAVLGAVLATTADASRADGATSVESFVDGFRVALVTGAVVALVGAAIAAVTIRELHGQRTSTQSAACRETEPA
jgi:EmrB/QacA subfamily drug resistance transporter